MSIMKNRELMIEQIKRLRGQLNESVEDSADDLSKELKKVILKHFPKSMAQAKFSKSLVPSVVVWFTIGKDKSEYPSGIYDNDPVLQMFMIYGFSKDGRPSDKIQLEQHRGGGFTIKPVKNKYMAYETHKVKLRKTTGTPQKIIATMDKYFAKLKAELKKNLSAMTDEHQQLVKSKI